LLPGLPHKPRWVDASGLSRYNLFTPKSMVYLLEKMYDEFGQERMFDLLPKNGEGGHLQKWYPFETTYLYAKTGSVSNNHNICGLLQTKKGTVLIFSYMNNHYMIESNDVRKEMNRVLQEIYNKY
jgi:D-alanyl-D-alanine carboxypeptidase/D-alanyl-D-alanine-endopeptidase (penicillin-binding protein 4)